MGEVRTLKIGYDRAGDILLIELGDVGEGPGALRQAISRGRLKATKRGRNWWVEDRDLQAYLAERKGTGPKRRVVAERADQLLTPN